MRRIPGIVVLTVACCWAVVGRSGEGDDARAIVDKAIKASGGEENLKKHQTATWDQKGTYYGMGDGVAYTGMIAVQRPDKFRMEVENVFTIVLNGEKGWRQFGGETQEMSKEEIERSQADNRAGWIASLAPLKDKAFTLTSIGEAKVDKKPALGVKVTRKGYPEVKLYFDKKTGLLVKSEFKTYSGEESKDVTQETFYQDYKEVDGAQVPSRVVMHREGKIYVEAEMSNFKSGKVDAKLFAKP